MSEVSITVSGEHAQRVTPELCDVSLSVQADSVDANEAVDKVTTTTNRISAILRELAPKAEVSSAVLDLEPPIVPDLPVTKWSVQRLQKYSRSNRVEDSRSEGEVPAVRGGPAARAFSTTTTYRNETRTYVSTSVNATFHDFKKLEEFVNTVTHEELVNVNDLSWSVTRKTRTQFDADVRAGAVKDAIAKAGHYAAALGPGGNLRVVEIHDRGSSGPPMYKPRMMMAAAHVGGGQQPPSLSFEPEPVEVSASVEVKAVF